MSVANLNSAGTLRCGKLVLAGQTIVPGAITTTVLTGQSGAGASGAVAVSTNITNTSAATALTFASTASTLELTGNISSAGGGGGTTVPTLWNDSNAYAVGDVVSVGSLASPTGTFICITAVSAPTAPAVNPAPSAAPTDWTPVAPLAGVASVVVGAGTPATGALTFAGAGVTQGTGAASNTFTFSGGGGGGSSITNAGATLAIDAAGTLSYTTPNTASFVNQINLTATAPTTTPGTNAGSVNIAGSGGILLTPGSGAVVLANPTAGYSSGNNLMSVASSAWSATAGYVAGQVVIYSGNGEAYLCIINKPPGASNPAPPADPTFWQPLGGSGGGGVASVVVGAGTPATGALTFAGAGVTQGTGAASNTFTFSGGASGVASLAGGGASPTLATGAVAFTSTVASGATTALTWTSSASGMELGGTIASASQTVPYIVAAGQKSWTTTGTTDSIAFSPALPTGTFAIFLSWGMATPPVALLSCPPPTAGATTAAVVASGSITAGDAYVYQVVKLT